MARVVKRFVGVGVLVVVTAWSWQNGLAFVPGLVLFFLLCGALDVRRNKPLNLAMLDNYFCGKGVLTWLLSPFNLLMDLLALPHTNKGIYKLEDLPSLHQREITRLIEAAESSDVIGQIESRITEARSMMFFKWYGRNVAVSVDVPAFHEEYETIRTIGLSIFNKRKSTSWHFGPLRATFRVLYNLRPTPDNAAFIQVGDIVHHWNDNPLFIFDDTLMHQSRNDSDEVRYCLFVDIVRPTKLRAVMNVIVAGLQRLLIRINRTFYKRWRMMK